MTTPPPLADAASRRPPSPSVRLLISDVDGTLVTPDKSLTPAAIAAVDAVRAAGVHFTVVSARPPRGMSPLIKALNITEPFAGFNGGAMATPDGSVFRTHSLSAGALRQALAVLQRPGLLVWAYSGGDWLVTDPAGPRVDQERHTLGYEPVVLPDFDGLKDIQKLVGVSLDPAALDRAEHEAKADLAGLATVDRSQSYYLDITHPNANKGRAARALAAAIGVPIGQTAVIGDMTNDVSMFDVAGLAVAMGQAAPAVKARADFAALANTEDGFADAVARFILPRTGLLKEPAAG